MTQINDDEPALLVAEYEKDAEEKLMLHYTGSKTKTIGTSEERETDIWYLDNSASNHMTGHREKFKKLDETVTGQVKFRDGSLVHIKEKGSINMMCKNGMERELKEVYFIPTLRSNIISLGQLSEEGHKVILEGDLLRVYDTSGKLLIRVKRASNRLYKIQIQETSGMCLLTKMEEAAWLWHARLGHVNF